MQLLTKKKVVKIISIVNVHVFIDFFIFTNITRNMYIFSQDIQKRIHAKFEIFITRCTKLTVHYFWRYFHIEIWRWTKIKSFWNFKKNTFIILWLSVGYICCDMFDFISSKLILYDKKMGNGAEKFRFQKVIEGNFFAVGW